MKKLIVIGLLLLSSTFARAQYLVVLKEHGVTRSYRCDSLRADSLIRNYLPGKNFTSAQALPFFEYREIHHYIYVELKKSKKLWKSKFSTQQKSARGESTSRR
jgi:hypothetical protein